MVRVEAFLNTWKQARQDSAQALLDMPAEALRFQPTPDLMRYRDLAVHILNASHAVTHLLMRGDNDMAAPDLRERMKPLFHAIPEEMGAEELAAKMEQVCEEDCQLLQSRPPEFFASMVKRFDGQQVTALELLQYMKEHELTHRSQMFMYLRLKGIIPPTTRRKMAAAKAR